MKYIKNKGWPPERAKEAYNDGYFAEAIQILHGWIEIKCRELLKLVGNVHFDTELCDTWDITEEIPLNNIIKTLFILGQITKEEYHGFEKLNRMRNKIIHQMFKDPYDEEFKGIPKNEYDSVFKRSLEYSQLLEEKIVDLVG